MNEIVELTKSLGTPAAILLFLWIQARKDAKPPTDQVVLREIVSEMRGINDSMSANARAMESVAQQFIRHDVSSVVTAKQVDNIHTAMQREGRL